VLIMKIVTRPEVRANTAKCLDCGVTTRSHVMELQEYEEYEEVWEDDEIEEYQGRKKSEKEEEEEEEQVIIRYQKVSDAVVMCHSCWVPKREKAIKFAEKKIEEWEKDPASHMRRINKFLKQWRYYAFDEVESPEVILRTEVALEGATK
jgi:hypothetical protein